MTDPVLLIITSLKHILSILPSSSSFPLSAMSIQGGRYINNIGLAHQYRSVLQHRASEDPVIGLWNTILIREWDGTDGFILIPQQQQQGNYRPDWMLIKWATDGSYFIIKAVLEAKPMDQEPQQDNISDEQLRGYAVNALVSARANGRPQTHVFAIKLVGTRFLMYDVRAGEERLLAQDRGFNFPGDANFQDNGDFQDVALDDGQLTELYRTIRRTKMT
ncbi:hypothetical protein HYALB_00014025 [Hymenoscyphus albidus]|uniref:Uncharacterized protein n=1 Tax=Hymenoscyphus albidus TaxID=595503 RepID=A0A9N9Q131_9HELO|nr:hypothetical protein HYALB_00014025 [Hymenoscyphus albidus]